MRNTPTLIGGAERKRPEGLSTDTAVLRRRDFVVNQDTPLPRLYLPSEPYHRRP
ncbi:hypothetical protein K443DRAFT_682542 [Laccaria amethystina LaAM-08-1]|uniref:Uncharacterized protein n=1 Tax=Laccaria amethystina LaAM-08-1 TaxID=1095629 RepID=A0A0C9XEG6_9AGAR|nr:hypothetical protein K443DRAFT_682542 [Laccaria amethystina LaAM-08-1]